MYFSAFTFCSNRACPLPFAYSCRLPACDAAGCQPATLPARDNAMAIKRPIVGDILMFRYPLSTSFKHYIYSDFPRGRRLSWRYCFMDFRDVVEVLQVKEGWIGRGWIVGIKFLAPDGRHVWTSYSNGWYRQQLYMLKIEVAP